MVHNKTKSQLVRLVCSHGHVSTLQRTFGDLGTFSVEQVLRLAGAAEQLPLRTGR